MCSLTLEECEAEERVAGDLRYSLSIRNPQS